MSSAWYSFYVLSFCRLSNKKRPSFEGQVSEERRWKKRIVLLTLHVGQEIAHAQPRLMQPGLRFVQADIDSAGDASVVVTFNVVEEENHALGGGQLDDGALQVRTTDPALEAAERLSGTPGPTAAIVAWASLDEKPAPATALTARTT